MSSTVSKTIWTYLFKWFSLYSFCCILVFRCVFPSYGYCFKNDDCVLYLLLVVIDILLLLNPYFIVGGASYMPTLIAAIPCRHSVVASWECTKTKIYTNITPILTLLCICVACQMVLNSHIVTALFMETKNRIHVFCSIYWHNNLIFFN